MSGDGRGLEDGRALGQPRPVPSLVPSASGGEGRDEAGRDICDSARSGPRGLEGMDWT